MSTYNGSKYIEEQINSILNQTGDFQLDLMIRDDGSNDDTLNIIGKYSNVQWYAGKNMGPAQSFIDLLIHTPGYDFYAFADQDDYWMPDKVSVGINALREKCVPALYCSNAEVVDADLCSSGRNVYRTAPSTDLKTYLCSGGLLGCTMVFNQQLAKIIQNQAPPARIGMHDFFTASLCLAVGGEIVYDHEAHMKYRQHGNNVVGVSQGFLHTLKSRIKDLFVYDEIGISGNACELIHYPVANDEIANWIDRVRLYRENLPRRVLLAFSLQTHYTNWNKAILHRLNILFGNQ